MIEKCGERLRWIRDKWLISIIKPESECAFESSRFQRQKPRANNNWISHGSGHMLIVPAKWWAKKRRSILQVTRTCPQLSNNWFFFLREIPFFLKLLNTFFMKLFYVCSIWVDGDAIDCNRAKSLQSWPTPYPVAEYRFQNCITLRIVRLIAWRLVFCGSWKFCFEAFRIALKDCDLLRFLTCWHLASKKNTLHDDPVTTHDLSWSSLCLAHIPEESYTNKFYFNIGKSWIIMRIFAG